jgi:hypothetical protein
MPMNSLQSHQQNYQTLPGMSSSLSAAYLASLPPQSAAYVAAYHASLMQQSSSILHQQAGAISASTATTSHLANSTNYSLHKYQREAIEDSNAYARQGNFASEQVRAAVAAATSSAGQKRSFLRMEAGTVWEDPTLAEWPENDYRLYVRNLGGEVSDKILAEPFMKWKSFAMAKVVRDKKESKGYGFVSFLDPFDALAAMKEMDNKYIGTRTVKIKRSKWADKQLDVKKAKEREK